MKFLKKFFKKKRKDLRKILRRKFEKKYRNQNVGMKFQGEGKKEKREREIFKIILGGVLNSHYCE